MGEPLWTVTGTSKCWGVVGTDTAGREFVVTLGNGVPALVFGRSNADEIAAKMTKQVQRRRALRGTVTYAVRSVTFTVDPMTVGGDK